MFLADGFVFTDILAHGCHIAIYLDVLALAMQLVSTGKGFPRGLDGLRQGIFFFMELPQIAVSLTDRAGALVRRHFPEIVNTGTSCDEYGKQNDGVSDLFHIDVLPETHSVLVRNGACQNPIRAGRF